MLPGAVSIFLGARRARSSGPPAAVWFLAALACSYGTPEVRAGAAAEATSARCTDGDCERAQLAQPPPDRDRKRQEAISAFVQAAEAGDKEKAVYLFNRCRLAAIGSPLHKQYVRIRQSLIDENISLARRALHAQLCFQFNFHLKSTLELDPANRQAVSSSKTACTLKEEYKNSNSESEAEERLTKAQNALASGQYHRSIELAQSVRWYSYIRVWRITGAAAFLSKNYTLARNSYGRLDERGKMYLTYVSGHSSIDVKSLSAMDLCKKNHCKLCEQRRD